MELKLCPSCGSKAIRDDKLTKGVEGAARCLKCSFCALISDWQSEKAESVDFPILRIIDDHLKNGAKIERQNDYVCLVRADDEIVGRGDTLQKLLTELILILC